MNRIKILALAALTSAAAFLAPAALAQPKAGTDYSELKAPQAVEVPGKVEVVEFFWYRCPHCYSLEPVLEAWVKKLPADVQFRRIPAVLSDNWAVDARIFYAFEALGVLDKVHKAFFDAIHKDRLNIANEAAMNEWLKKNGIDRKKFDDAVKSFGVQAKVKRAAQLSANYQLDGVPMLAVQGKYTVSAEQGGTQNGMLATTDHLIDVARKGLGKK
ncbi:MAG: thiol:disulfide interchange protein DsbA/DsbL [Proteobacteria bacterium]|nr:thiol:disulfide interchange protein DsbA/DsbL [Pseudomonadota bacterium]